MSKYDHKKIEKKWQKNWEKSGIYKTRESKDKPKYYVLDMFPYPSGAGLHVGHPKGYIATDIVARMKMMQGYNVLHPMGWDAFGLPAENYALENKVHPSAATAENIKTFKKQMGLLGFTYDWDREVNTTDPAYYKWTQWAFLQMFKKGLVYESYEPINWCPKCKTGLANEDLEGGACERCGSEIEKKPMRQWVIKITDYAERLLADLEKLSGWPESIKTMQKEWIGKSEGALVDFSIPKFSGVLLATNNKGKVERVKKLLKYAGVSTKILTPAEMGIEILETEEDGDLLENAEKKAKAYKGKVNIPVLAGDTGFFIENEKIDPVKIKRNALGGTNEKELSQEQIADKLLNYYKKIAEEHGGAVDASWHDAWAFLLPSGEMMTAVSKRDVTLTDKVKGEVNKYFPVRSLYKVKSSGKYTFEQSIEEELREMAPVTKVLADLLCEKLTVFTTRPDTLFGATYMVVAPEHAIISKIKNQISNIKEVEEYIIKAKKKSEKDRGDATKEKTGVELRGIKAVNPVNGEELPIFVADYIVAGYGTGAIMAVPAHDERDFAFAKKYNLPIREVIMPSLVDHINTPRAGKENTKRNIILAVLHDPKIDKYLTLKWKTQPWRTFVTGGIENGENAEEAAKREITEETGYTNIRFARPLGQNETFFFAAHKDVNRQVHVKHFLFELVDETRVPISVEEKEQYDQEWMTFEEMRVATMQHVEKDLILGRIKEEVDSPYVGNGVMINSGKFDGMKNESAGQAIVAGLDKQGVAKRKTMYKLRDWVFSRQRYWGEPIPLVRCEKCGWVPVPEKDLPLELPKVKNYEPSGTGESPLATIEKWVNTKCPVCGGPAKRETNTMPQWAGSCWYYLRYIDPKNDKEPVDKEKEKYWSPVDLYVGGAEHATRHLIYARFWHKFLYDIGAVAYEEPFTRLQNVGLILAEDGRKMSKRWGNVINPDDVVDQFGADSMRLYEMFMGPFNQPCAWSTTGLIGMRRFLEKVWNLSVIASEARQSHRGSVIPAKAGIQILARLDSRFHGNDNGIAASPSAPRNDKVTTLLHQTIKKVTEDIEHLRFNTAIAQLMILVNEMIKQGEATVDSRFRGNDSHKDQDTSLRWDDSVKIFLQLLAPFAPHIAEELWEKLGHKDSIFIEPWPKYDSELAKDKEITIAIQVNGKLRDTLTVPADITEADAKTQALSSDKIQKWLAGQTPKKIIYIKNKLISIVV